MGLRFDGKVALVTGGGGGNDNLEDGDPGSGRFFYPEDPYIKSFGSESLNFI